MRTTLAVGLAAAAALLFAAILGADVFMRARPSNRAANAELLANPPGTKITLRSAAPPRWIWLLVAPGPMGFLPGLVLVAAVSAGLVAFSARPAAAVYALVTMAVYVDLAARVDRLGDALTLDARGFTFAHGRERFGAAWETVTEWRAAWVDPISRVMAAASGGRRLPNGIVWRTNRALTGGRLRYFDGAVPNSFGVDTTALEKALTSWQEAARARGRGAGAGPPP